LRERGLQGLRFYDGATHQSLFMLAREVREQLRAGRIATDSCPTFMPI
jgi:hypothetical protein